MQRVVVVGAGVIGLSAALHLVERFPGEVDVTVLADKFSPEVTSDQAGTLLMPIDFRSEEEKSNSPHNQEEQVKRWTRATFSKFHSLYRSQENARLEICLQQGYLLFESPLPEPWYKEEVFGFRHVAVDSVEAGVLHVPPACVDVWSFSTYIVETTSYLRWLTQQLHTAGVKCQQRKVSSLDQLSSYDIIINCTGLGSRDLLGDQLVYPVRGQTVRVKAPWMKQWLVRYGEGRLDYIFPRGKDVLLGGTLQPNNFQVTPDPETTTDIARRCQEYFPGLREAEVIGSSAGLRPLRDPIRLESCQGPAGGLLIHCYGHGGQGVVLSWGCALDVGDIVQHSLHPNDVCV